MAPSEPLNLHPAPFGRRTCLALHALLLVCASTLAFAGEHASLATYTYADEIAAGYAAADELPGPYAYADESGGPSRSGDFGGDRPSTAGLEEAFWQCDYEASARGVGVWEALLCSNVYDDLKRTKFDGDFRALLEWWEKNKSAKHQAAAKADSVDAR